MSVVEHCLTWVWLWVWFPSTINKGKWYNDSRWGTRKSKNLNAQNSETAGTRYSNINESGLDQKQGKKGGASHSCWQEMEQKEPLLPLPPWAPTLSSGTPMWELFVCSFTRWEQPWAEVTTNIHTTVSSNTESLHNQTDQVTPQGGWAYATLDGWSDRQFQVKN